MANKGPVLLELKDQSEKQGVTAPAGSPPQPPRPSREVVVAGISAIVGAALAVGGNLVQENLKLGNHAPTVTVSSVQLFTPELTIPNKDNPSPPSNVDKELEVLTEHLGLSDEKMNVRTDEAENLIKAATKTSSLSSIDSPLKYLKIDAWVSDIREAAKDVIGYYTAETLFEGLHTILIDGSLTREQARDSFVKLLDQNPEYPKIFWLSDWPYTLDRTQGSIISAKQDKKFRELILQKPVFDIFEVSSPPLSTYAVAVGRMGIVLDPDKNVVRSAANRNLAIAVSRFDRDELATITKRTSDDLLREISNLQAFLNESERLIKHLIKPRIAVETTAFNPSRAPITVAPYAVLRVTGKNNIVSDIALNMATTGREDTSHSREEYGDTIKYATIDSGHFLKWTWSGEFYEEPVKWDALTSAYNKGPLSCELTLETLGNLRARSPAAPFGTPSTDASKEALKLVAAD